MLAAAQRRDDSTASRLYVTNLSTFATQANVRQLFSVVGEVVKVELAGERRQGQSPTEAFVTMATRRDAENAVQKLSGRLFHDRSVMVSFEAPASDEGRYSRKAKAPAADVAITQQYRERQGMAYELNCTGLHLTLRFSFEDGSAPRRVAITAKQWNGLIAEATGATRELALVAAADVWRELVVEPPAPALDWAGITAALRAVRAI